MISKKLVKATFTSLVLVTVLFLNNSSFADKPSDVGKPSISVEELKKPQTIKKDGKNIVKFVHIFYKKNISEKISTEKSYYISDIETFHHKPGHEGGSGSGGSGEKCFSFLANGLKWKITEDFIVNTSNQDGLSETFVNAAVDAAVNEWDSQVSFDIFGTRIVNNEFNQIGFDGTNVILFGEITDARVIAAVIAFGVAEGKPNDRQLEEWDMILNDAYITFGDAFDDASVFDLQNIITHELGHSAGLDHPPDSCGEETMYRFAQEGETKKRTLNIGDEQGIKRLYR